MPTIKTKDGSRSITRIGVRVSPSCSAMAGRCRPMTGTRRCCFFLNRGYRVIAHDRRGHGRSAQVGDGHDMDHYADDLAALTAHLDLKTSFTSAIPPAAARGGALPLARRGESGVAKAAILCAVPP